MKFTHALVVVHADEHGDGDGERSQAFRSFIPAFRRLFDVVTVFPQDRQLRQAGYFASADALRRRIADARPDVVFVVPYENQVDWGLIRELTSSGITTLAWMTDDDVRWGHFHRHIASSFTAIISSTPSLYVGSHVRVIPTSWNFDLDAVSPPNAPRDIPVSFVGPSDPRRRWVIGSLRRAGVPVRTAGSGWENQEHESLSAAEELLARSRITLHLRPFPLARSRHSVQGGPPAARSGACIVAEPNPELSSYRPGSDLVECRGVRSLAEVARRLLDDEGHRRSLADRASETTRRQHTYDGTLERALATLDIPKTTRAGTGELEVIGWI